MNYFVSIILILIFPNVAIAGPTTAQRKTQFEKALAVIMASATPQTSSQIREALIKDYMEAKPNKGQAVQLVEGNYFRSTLHEDQAVVGDRTLEACQLRFAKPCALLAINDEITAEGELVSRDMRVCTMQKDMTSRKFQSFGWSRENAQTYKIMTRRWSPKPWPSTPGERFLYRSEMRM